MQKKVNLAMLALFSCSLAMALGEDDDMSSNVTIYTTETGSTLNSFTFTYDFSSVNSKYFTIGTILLVLSTSRRSSSH